MLFAYLWVKSPVEPYQQVGTDGREPVGAAWGGSTVFPGLHTGTAPVSDADPAVQDVVPLSPQP